MHIRFLIMNAYAGGGTVRTTFNLASGLAARHEVEVVSVYRTRDEPVLRLDPAVRLHALSDDSPSIGRALPAMARPVRRAVRAAARRRPSRIIHPLEPRYPNFSLLTDRALARFLDRLDGGVLVGTRVGLNLAMAERVSPSVVRVAQEHLHLGRYKPPLVAEISRLFPRLDAVGSLTEKDAAAYRSLLGPSVRVAAIPNAVPDTGQGISPLTAKVVVAVGRHAHQKGFKRLVTAWRTVARKHPDWRLRIYGDGPQRAPLQAHIDTLGLGDVVSLEGFTTSLYDELRRASILAMSSAFEGFPMTLLEAMSCGLPVVSFDCDNGPRDLIEPGVSGILVPDRDVPALAAGICELIEDPAKRRRIADNGREHVSDYALPIITARWEQLFQELAHA